jgi:hypothetical protein
MTCQDHTDDESTASSWSTVSGTAAFDQAHRDTEKPQDVVNNVAAKRFAALNKFHNPPVALYNGKSVTLDYRDLLTHVVENFEDHCFSREGSDIPIAFTIEGSSVKAINKNVNGRQIIGDLFAMDSLYLDLKRFARDSIPVYTKAGSIDKLCLKILMPRSARQQLRVSSLDREDKQGLEAVSVLIDPNKPPIFTTINKQCINQQETFVLCKHGTLTDFAAIESNRAIYQGTGFFTATVSDRYVKLTLVGTRIFGKADGILPVPWTGNSAENLGI